jgi:hypothetical protein
MSGTGSSFGQADYVALNTAAIAASLLGVASALALALNLFLLIPLSGILVGLFAIRKIRHSNGTQGGMAFAVGGILLSLGFGGVAGGRAGADWLRVRAEVNYSADLIARFGDAMRDGQYDYAYDHLMGSGFRERIDRKRFSNFMHGMQMEPNMGYGHIEWIKWNGERMAIEPFGDNFTRLNAIVLIKFHAYSEPSHDIFQISNRDGSWLIENLPHEFPDKKPDKLSL